MSVSTNPTPYQAFIAADNQNNKNKIKSLQMQIDMTIRRLDDCSEINYLQRIDILRKQAKCLSNLVDCLSRSVLMIDAKNKEDLRCFDAAFLEARESLNLHPR